MVDTCVITKAGPGTGAFNETTGQYDTPARVVVYTGRCRIQDASLVGGQGKMEERGVGDHEATYLTMKLQLPVEGGSAMVRPDQRVEITRSCGDPELEGRMFFVESTHHKTHATHRRFRIREVIG